MTDDVVFVSLKELTDNGFTAPPVDDSAHPGGSARRGDLRVVVTANDSFSTIEANAIQQVVTSPAVRSLMLLCEPSEGEAPSASGTEPAAPTIPCLRLPAELLTVPTLWVSDYSGLIQAANQQVTRLGAASNRNSNRNSLMHVLGSVAVFDHAYRWLKSIDTNVAVPGLLLVHDQRLAGPALASLVDQIIMLMFGRIEEFWHLSRLMHAAGHAWEKVDLEIRQSRAARSADTEEETNGEVSESARDWDDLSEQDQNPALNLSVVDDHFVISPRIEDGDPVKLPNLQRSSGSSGQQAARTEHQFDVGDDPDQSTAESDTRLAGDSDPGDVGDRDNNPLSEFDRLTRLAPPKALLGLAVALAAGSAAVGPIAAIGLLSVAVASVAVAYRATNSQPENLGDQKTVSDAPDSSESEELDRDESAKTQPTSDPGAEKFDALVGRVGALLLESLTKRQGTIAPLSLLHHDPAPLPMTNGHWAILLQILGEHLKSFIVPLLDEAARLSIVGNSFEPDDQLEHARVRWVPLPSSTRSVLRKVTPSHPGVGEGDVFDIDKLTADRCRSVIETGEAPDSMEFMTLVRMVERTVLAERDRLADLGLLAVLRKSKAEKAMIGELFDTFLYDLDGDGSISVLRADRLQAVASDYQNSEHGLVELCATSHLATMDRAAKPLVFAYGRPEARELVEWSLGIETLAAADADTDGLLGLAPVVRGVVLERQEPWEVVAPLRAIAKKHGFLFQADNGSRGALVDSDRYDVLSSVDEFVGAIADRKGKAELTLEAQEMVVVLAIAGVSFRELVEFDERYPALSEYREKGNFGGGQIQLLLPRYLSEAR